MDRDCANVWTDPRCGIGVEDPKRIPPACQLTTAASGPLRDSFGRNHDYLRVSLTERCNLRCKYCMPEEGIALTKSTHMLSIEELKYLTTLLVEQCGIKKVRLTGGEPTIDRKLFPILEHLSGLKKLGLQTIAMTTNGLTLKSKADQYKDSGLDMINISLDTLKPEKFEKMTRRRGWPLVFKGLERALEIGFIKVKLNCVVMRGINDDELVDFVRLARDMPVEVRFIEFMPFMGNSWMRDSLVSYHEMLQTIRQDFPDLASIKTGANETSKLFRQPGMLGSVGFISSLTDNFCSGCNRLRLTADGNLKVCLFDRRETSLRDLLRNGASDGEIVDSVSASLRTKKRQHAGLTNLPHDVSRPMVKIDGDPPAVGLAKFSHLDNSGEARMVNVGAKPVVRRTAQARGEIRIGRRALSGLLDGSIGTKGDILSVAKVAGILGAKATSNLIPMCHQIPLNHVRIEIEPRTAEGTLVVTAKVEADHKTGIELECMTAVSITLLTIYDMCKSASRDMVISDVRLVHKSKTKLAAT